MPEGPSIVLAIAAMKKFEGRKVLKVSGNTTTIEKHDLQNKTIVRFRSWGKHLLICFSKFTIRIHFLLFGSYAVDEEKNKTVRLGLEFTNGKIYFYTCSVKRFDEAPDQVYDWSADVMNDDWNPAAARKKLKSISETQICDALLDQDIFAGVGNIIKNEILYRVKIHPESICGKIPAKKINVLIRECRHYSFQFLEWKKAYVLRKHWLVHNKSICNRCKIKLKRKHTGVKNRRSFFCEQCQYCYV